MTEAARRPLRWIIPSAIAIFAIVVGGVAWAQLRPVSPASVAVRFWQFLADGKAQQALALSTTPDAPSAPNGLLLTDAAYSAADRGIADVTPGATRTSGDTATVELGYTEHGARRTARVELRKDRTTWLQPSSWKVTNPPISSVTATVAGQGHANALSVDGNALPVHGDGTVVIPALPGTYGFALGSSTKLLAPVPQKVSVGEGKPAAVTLGLAASAALGPAAVAAADKLITGCFVGQGIAASCPLRQALVNLVPLTAEDGLLYRLSPAPKLAFDAKSMRVTSTSDGTMLVSTVDHVWGNLPNSAVFSVALDVVVDGDSVKLVPHDSGVALVNYTGATA
jgi:hypothetical protein